MLPAEVRERFGDRLERDLLAGRRRGVGEQHESGIAIESVRGRDQLVGQQVPQPLRVTLRAGAGTGEQECALVLAQEPHRLQ